MGDNPEILNGVDDEADWERVLGVAAHVQSLLDEGVLVGGTASALYAQHRYSHDDDRVIEHLRDRFADVLKTLENVAGWTTASVMPPVLILGNFDGVQTGIRNLIREDPLQTELLETPYGRIRVPTLGEITRIKAFLIAQRNATRDYLDFAALVDRLERDGGGDLVWESIRSMDRLYPQKNGESVLRQLAKQLAEPRPHDLGENESLDQYRILKDEWKSWDRVTAQCKDAALLILSRFDERELPRG